MPIYVYQVVTPSGEPGEVFEHLQRVDDPPLTHHPETGLPVRRIVTAPNIGGSWSDSAMSKSVQDDKKLDRLGFTKYVKAGDGIYEKRSGQGPRTIGRDGKPLSD